MKYWFDAAEGKLDPFVLVMEGSVPNEKIKKEGYWAALGTDPDTGQPITTNEWIDRLAPKALGIVACGTCATYGGIQRSKHSKIIRVSTMAGHRDANQRSGTWR